MSETQKKPRKKKSKKEDETFSQNNKHTIGIKKTQLMKLAEKYGDSGLMNPRTIDPLVHMLAEMGENAFGKSVIENCAEQIALTNAGFPKQKALGFLADRMVRKYIAGEFRHSNKGEIASRLSKMPVLNQASYTDYFMTVSMMERDAFRTRMAPAMDDMVKMITGYQTEQPHNVCAAVVNFFSLTKDQHGFEELLTEFCSLVKTKRT